MNLRIGHGIDVHKLSSGIPLILGGINLILLLFFPAVIDYLYILQKKNQLFHFIQNKKFPPKNLKFAFSDSVNDDQLKPN